MDYRFFGLRVIHPHTFVSLAGRCRLVEKRKKNKRFHFKRKRSRSNVHSTVQRERDREGDRERERVSVFWTTLSVVFQVKRFFRSQKSVEIVRFEIPSNVLTVTMTQNF